MGVLQNMCALALQQVAGESAGALIGLLGSHFTDRGQLIVTALRVANERAWRALEIALAGDSWWERVKSHIRPKEDQAFAHQIRTFLQGLPLDELAGQAAEGRQQCLAELQHARKEKLLTEGQFAPQELAEHLGQLSSATPQTVLKAQWQALHGMGDALRATGYAWLAWLAEQRPRGGSPLLVLAVRHFFRREVETNAELARGLIFTQLDTLGQSQSVALKCLHAALVQQGQRMDVLLNEAVQIIRKTLEVAEDTREGVARVEHEVARQGQQIEELRREVLDAFRETGLRQCELGPRDSFSIRNDAKRQLIKELRERFGALPSEQRRQAADVLVFLGILEAAAGDVASGQKDMETGAEGLTDERAKADAYFSAYRAALENRDWKKALEQLTLALKFDARRLAPFALARYQPIRILGAGGFGVAFLCQHRFMSGLQVVVKALFQEELERSVEDVFSEASLLSMLNDPALVKINDCGYVNAGAKSRPYLVMEYFDGESLEDYVKAHGCLAPADLKQILKPIAQALQTAHQKGILHRDIKPANILVRRDADGWHVKLIDFGLALKQEALQHTIESPAGSDRTVVGMSIAGTVDYAAPEQMGKLRGVELGPHSDVYAFGKTCYYALLGTPTPDDYQRKQLEAGWRNFLTDCTANPPNRILNFEKVWKRLEKLKGIKTPVGTKNPARNRSEAKRKGAATTTEPTDPLELLLLGQIEWTDEKEAATSTEPTDAPQESHSQPAPPSPSPVPQVSCPHCGRLLILRDASPGATMRCPACSGTFRVAQQSSLPSPAPQTSNLGASVSETFTVSCPHCEKVLLVPGNHRGWPLKCPGCSGQFRLTSR